MFCVITGGSGSGKSEYAENLIQTLCNKSGGGIMYYFATMVPFGEETEKKIQRHRTLRAGKGFSTVECYTGLKNTVENVRKEQEKQGDGSKKTCVLLECMSNLAANELYMENGAKKQTVQEILEGIRVLQKWCEHLVVVTNEIFSEAEKYTEEMQCYKKVLGEINCRMGERAEYIAEVVYGIPFPVKAEARLIEQITKRNSKDTRERMTIQMKLIVGGSCQGKQKAAQEEYPEIEWCDGAVCSMDAIYSCQGIYHFEAFIRRRLKENPDLEAETFVSSLAEKNPKLVLISDIVGCGLVPVDVFERLYREQTGRICTCIARRAEEVLYVICGRKIWLKGPGDKHAGAIDGEK